MDESFNQLTIGKHHIVVVKPRGTIEKDINTAVVDHWSPGNRNMRACSKHNGGS